MKYILIFNFLVFFSLSSIAQNSYPNPLPFKQIEYLNAAKVKSNYDCSKSEKKAFLFFDMVSEPLAEVMFNGANFVFNERKLTVFPVYFTGQLTKKTSDDMNSKIPIQLYRSPEMSIFKEFGITEKDLPLIVVYNEKNELCGFSKTVEGISDIDCGLELTSIKVLRLKIMVEGKNKDLSPYADKEVFVLGGKNNDTIARLTTNKYGDFNTEIPDLTQDYLITVNEKNKSINFVVLGTQSGKVLGKFKSTDKGFEYRILQTELVTLPDIKIEEDVEMKISSFKQKELNNFIITETLYYELGESSLSASSKQLIEKIKKVLDSYPDYKLKVISHTDSQGDDESNLSLSIKRAQTAIDYFNSLGIGMDRLSAEGKGEQEIRNRCKNGVDCSDKEHEYNRRTEFKFTKK
ncbi:MAG TPA: OmpA family protein [Bacteroidia bacterium]|nr:OmpA family protein [Bacteroidia bacterium]